MFLQPEEYGASSPALSYGKGFNGTVSALARQDLEAKQGPRGFKLKARSITPASTETKLMQHSRELISFSKIEIQQNFADF